MGTVYTGVGVDTNGVATEERKLLARVVCVSSFSNSLERLASVTSAYDIYHMPAAVYCGTCSLNKIEMPRVVVACLWR